MRVVHNSGTIRKAEEEAIRRARADILRAQGEGGDTEEPSEVNMLNEIFGSGSNKAPQLDEADDTDDSGMEVDENTELDTAHHK